MYRVFFNDCPTRFGTETLKYSFLQMVLDLKRARAALESSSKRGCSDRISNCQEFWSIEMGYLTYGNGNRALEVFVVAVLKTLVHDLPIL